MAVKRTSIYRTRPRERIVWCEILARNVWNLPWSLCVKTQRDTSVNGEKENYRKFSKRFYD